MDSDGDSSNDDDSYIDIGSENRSNGSVGRLVVKNSFPTQKIVGILWFSILL